MSWTGYALSSGLMRPGFGSDCANPLVGTCTINVDLLPDIGIGLGWVFGVN